MLLGGICHLRGLTSQHNQIAISTQVNISKSKLPVSQKPKGEFFKIFFFFISRLEKKIWSFDCDGQMVKFFGWSVYANRDRKL